MLGGFALRTGALECVEDLCKRHDMRHGFDYTRPGKVQSHRASLARKQGRFDAFEHDMIAGRGESQLFAWWHIQPPMGVHHLQHAISLDRVMQTDEAHTLDLDRLKAISRS